MPRRFETVVARLISLTGKGFSASSGVIQLWPHCHSGEDEVALCCGYKLLAFSQSAVERRALQVQGEIEVKAVSLKGCGSGGTAHGEGRTH